MNVADLLAALHNESKSRVYFSRLDRHITTEPDLHDTSAEGMRSVDLREFLDEVETVLASLGLP